MIAYIIGGAVALPIFMFLAAHGIERAFTWAGTLSAQNEKRFFKIAAGIIFAIMGAGLGAATYVN